MLGFKSRQKALQVGGQSLAAATTTSQVSGLKMGQLGMTMQAQSLTTTPLTMSLQMPALEMPTLSVSAFKAGFTTSKKGFWSTPSLSSSKARRKRGRKTRGEYEPGLYKPSLFGIEMFKTRGLTIKSEPKMTSGFGIRLPTRKQAKAAIKASKVWSVRL